MATEIPLTVHIGKTTPADVIQALGPPPTDRNVGGPDNGALSFKDGKGSTERRINYMLWTRDGAYVNLTVCLENGQCLNRVLSPAGTAYNYVLFYFEFENEVLRKVWPVVNY